MPEIPSNNNTKQKEDVNRNKEEFFASLNASASQSVENQKEDFFESLKDEKKPIVKKSESIADNNSERRNLLSAGFSNQEINDYLGTTDESPDDSTHPLIRAIGNSADYLAITLPQNVGSVITGSASWFLSKGAGAIIGLREGMDSGDYEKGMQEGKRIEELIANKLTSQPTDSQAKLDMEVLSNVIEWFTGPAKEVSEIAETAVSENPILQAIGYDKLAPWIKYISEFGTELLMFKMAHSGAKTGGRAIESGLSKAETKIGRVKAKPKDVADVVIDNVLRDKSPEQALTDYKGVYPETSEKVTEPTDLPKNISTDRNVLANYTADRLKLEQSEMGELKQRKFIQTVKESPTTEEGLRTKVEDIKPQEYTVQPNKESLAKAEERISTSAEEAERYVLSDEAVSAEKGATFVSLIEKNQNEGRFDKAVELVEAYDMQLRESGRFIQAASIWNKLTPEGFLRWAQKEINKVNNNRGFIDKILKKKSELTKSDKEYIIEEMNKIQQMPEGIEKNNATLNIIDFVAQKTPPGIVEIIDAYRYQNMLSGWQTQERNIGENLFNTFVTRPYDLTMKGAIDHIESGLFGKERESFVKDVPLYYKSVLNSIPNAVEAFRATWRGDLALEKPDLGVNTRSIFQQRRTRQLPRSLTIVQRFMEASDRFNSSLIGAGEYAINIKKGMTEANAREAATKLAEKYLYREKTKITDNTISYASKAIADLGQLVSESRHLPVIGKPMGWFIPFIRTPINKGIAMIEHSPLAIFRKGFDAESKAKIFGGAAITAIGSVAAYQNKTTWAPPSTQKEKQFFYASGKKPFSVLIPTPTGEKWVPMWYLGPFALAFALPTAAKYYSEDQRTAYTKDAFEKMVDIAGGTARFIGSQSSTQSIGAFFNIMSGDLDYTFPGQLGFTTEQMIPLSGLIRTVNKIYDPVYRKPSGYLESIMKDLPVLSKQLQPHETPFGEEATRERWSVLLPYEYGNPDALYEYFDHVIQKEGQLNNLLNTIQKEREKIKYNRFKPEKEAEYLEKLDELLSDY